MNECSFNFLEYLLCFWNTWIATPKGVATLLLGFIICLKLYTNRKAEAIDYKHMIMSIPGEILFLVLGFQVSNMIEESSSGTVNALGYFAKFLIILFLLNLQYAFERWSDDKIAGDLEWKIIIYVGIMYLISIGIYIASVYGGL